MMTDSNTSSHMMEINKYKSIRGSHNMAAIIRDPSSPLSSADASRIVNKQQLKALRAKDMAMQANKILEQLKRKQSNNSHTNDPLHETTGMSALALTAVSKLQEYRKAISDEIVTSAATATTPLAISSICKQYDVNRNGYINYDDFSSILSISSSGISKSDAHALASKIDSDSIGLISYRDLLDSLQSMANKSSKPSTSQHDTGGNSTTSNTSVLLPQSQQVSQTVIEDEVPVQVKDSIQQSIPLASSSSVALHVPTAAISQSTSVVPPPLPPLTIAIPPAALEPSELPHSTIVDTFIRDNKQSISPHNDGSGDTLHDLLQSVDKSNLNQHNGYKGKAHMIHGLDASRKSGNILDDLMVKNKLRLHGHTQAYDIHGLAHSNLTSPIAIRTATKQFHHIRKNSHNILLSDRTSNATTSTATGAIADDGSGYRPLYCSVPPNSVVKRKGRSCSAPVRSSSGVFDTDTANRDSTSMIEDRAKAAARMKKQMDLYYELMSNATATATATSMKSITPTHYKHHNIMRSDSHTDANQVVEQVKRSICSQLDGRVSTLNFILKKLDQSGSGLVNFSELQAGIRKVGTVVSPDHMQCLFKQLSTPIKDSHVWGGSLGGYSDNNAVNINTFIDTLRVECASPIMATVLSSPDAIIAANRRRLMKHILHESSKVSDPLLIFKSFDMNNDGWISPHAFEDGLKHMNIHLSTGDINTVIESVDRDIDGNINLNDVDRLLHTTVDAYDRQHAIDKIDRLRQHSKYTKTYQSSDVLHHCDQSEYNNMAKSRTAKHDQLQWSKLKAVLQNEHHSILKAFGSSSRYTVSPTSSSSSSSSATCDDIRGSEINLCDLQNKFADNGIYIGTDDVSLLHHKIRQVHTHRWHTTMTVDASDSIDIDHSNSHSHSHSHSHRGNKISLQQLCDVLGLKVEKDPHRHAGVVVQPLLDDTMTSLPLSVEIAVAAAGNAMGNNSNRARTLKNYSNRPIYDHTYSPSKFWELSHHTATDIAPVSSTTATSTLGSMREVRHRGNNILLDMNTGSNSIGRNDHAVVVSPSAIGVSGVQTSPVGNVNRLKRMPRSPIHNPVGGKWTVFNTFVSA